MLDHHLQRAIVYRLAFLQDARFSDLKPGEIENKLFTYHLKKTISAGYVAKSADGSYSLTPVGRRLGVRIANVMAPLADQPQSVLFLVIRRKSDGAWLLYRRATHPILGRAGFMHAMPNAELDAAVAARQQCLAWTGLDGKFTALGGGYFKLFDGSNLESYTHFSLLYCNEIQGELKVNDPLANYSWFTRPNFSGNEMIPNTKILSDLYIQGQPFFIEQTFTINQTID